MKYKKGDLITQTFYHTPTPTIWIVVRAETKGRYKGLMYQLQALNDNRQIVYLERSFVEKAYKMVN